MSRTIRRKNEQIPKWVTHDWEKLHFYSRGWFRSLKESKDLIKSKAIWYSDNQPPRDGPTKWFRQSEQRVIRIKGKAEILKFVKDENYEIQLYRTYKLWDFWY